MALNVFEDAAKSAGSPGGTLFVTPSPADRDATRFTPLEWIGATVVLDFDGAKEILVNGAPKMVIVCSRVVAIRAGKAETFTDVLIFSKGIVSQLQRMSPTKGLIARMSTYTPKVGNPAPELDTATEEDQRLAAPYVGQAPF